MRYDLLLTGVLTLATVGGIYYVGLSVGRLECSEQSRRTEYMGLQLEQERMKLRKLSIDQQLAMRKCRRAMEACGP